ncbi:hypothetical protein ACFFGV_17725 [Pontibacillus salicampi]|uniref:Flagellar protein FliT n=1 Tax=Pontibacillus salicampi TaxID=1449801 RepID=A0ABV6LSQ9_9BACI
MEIQKMSNRDVMISIYEITKKMNAYLDNTSSQTRVKTFEEVNALLDARSTLLNQLEDINKEDPLLVTIKQLNQEVDAKINQNFTSLKNEMIQFRKQYSSNEKYRNPYKNVSGFDGMYLDKKK